MGPLDSENHPISSGSPEHGAICDAMSIPVGCRMQAASSADNRKQHGPVNRELLLAARSFCSDKETKPAHHHSGIGSMQAEVRTQFRYAKTQWRGRAYETHQNMAPHRFSTPDLETICPPLGQLAPSAAHPIGNSWT